jgi:hypothetical protein
MTCYRKLNLWLDEENPILQEYKTYEYKHRDASHTDKRNTFLQYHPPVELFNNNKKLSETITRYNLRSNIFTMAPNTTYNWHRDATRYAAFNCLLGDDPDYLTVFASDMDSTKSMYFSSERLVYERNRFYLLNTQVSHLVVNYSKNYRSVLTLGVHAESRLNNQPPDFTQFNELVLNVMQDELIADD